LKLTLIHLSSKKEFSRQRLDKKSLVLLEGPSLQVAAVYSRWVVLHWRQFAHGLQWL